MDAPINSNAGEGKGPNCWQCRHFAITHQPATPYACRLMGFQTRSLPALQVLQIDGHFCRGFSVKRLHQNQAA